MRKNWLSRIFIGSQGLRSGWGLLLYIVIFAVSFCVVLGAQRLLANGSSAYVAAQKHLQAGMLGLEAVGPGLLLLIYAPSLAVVLFVPWIMSLIERRPVGVYGLGDGRRLLNFAKGVLSGFVLISLLVGLLWIFRLLVFDGLEPAGGRLLFYGLKWFFVFCLVGLSEGYLSLGYLQFTLRRAFSAWFPKDNPLRAFGGFWLAAVLLSAGFSLGHSAHATESPVGLFSAFLFGMVSAYSLWQTGSLWWSIGVHAAWDWGQSFVYGVSDSGVRCQGRLLTAHPVGDPWLSGGLTGPEGSVFAIGVLLIGALLVRLMFPKRQRTETSEAAISVSQLNSAPP